jgi:elongation factor 3
MLMRADVLLLDEPTNHLDVANVAWLQDYLKKHTEITSLIVSHDSGFLDAVCTDIYHYEQKKLVNYKGNLADFVRVKPEAKSYYTLTDSQVQFKFPPPGILTGVKSNTRSILRMTNCTHTLVQRSRRCTRPTATCRYRLVSQSSAPTVLVNLHSSRF